ncbi:MAG: short-chain dehydrogenase/reductase SDR [Anaerolineaceae bacterium]|nr:short-chain dehydrogenase/reductase SDR [Anaerolineaceae bacterium]
MSEQALRVIVTGAGRGIGHEIVRAFVRQGAFVSLSDIDGAAAEQAADQINAELSEDRVRAYEVDVADVEAVDQMMDDFSGHVGPITTVIANAGVTVYKPFLETDVDLFDRIVGINVRGTYFTAQAGAKRMVENQVPGRIVLLSSVTGQRAFRDFSLYSTTKAAVAMMAQAMALELGEFGINVNAISPGAILTERTRREEPEYGPSWAEVIPKGRVGHVEDIANTALWLASDASSHVTGQNIAVDGGWLTYGRIP